MNGLFSTDPYMNHTKGIGKKDLNEFTLCQRFNVNFFRGISSYPLSYANIHSDNAVNIQIERNRKKKISFYISKYRYKYGIEVLKYDLKYLKIHQEWHHICTTFEYNRVNSNLMQSTITLFHNGKKVAKGMYKVDFVKKKRTILVLCALSYIGR